MRITRHKGALWSFIVFTRMFLFLTPLVFIQGCEVSEELSNSTENPINSQADINNVKDLDLNSLERVRVLNHNNLPSKILVSLLNNWSSQIAFVEDLCKIVEEINQSFQRENSQLIKVVIVADSTDLISTLNISDEFKNNFLEVIQMKASSNVWLQDFGEIMVAKTKSDDNEQLLLFDSNRGQGLRDLAVTLADFWNGYYYKFPEMSIDGNYGGNIEVTPNNILYLGSNSTEGLREFFSQYGYQDQMLILDTKWLRVGHIDEFVSTILLKDDPCGFGLVKADPNLALDLLKKAPTADIEQLLELPNDQEYYDFLRMEALQQYLNTGEDLSSKLYQQIVETQANIAQTINESVVKLKEKIIEVSPQCHSIKEISFPVIFVEGLALLPNPVNMTVLRDHQIISDPFFKPYRESIENQLRSLNQTPHFINDLFYHQHWGDVHCGTNVVRLQDKFFVE